MGQCTSLSYNEFASAAIDQERLMKAVAEADEKKRTRMMYGSSVSGGSSSAPPKYHVVYTPPGDQLCRPQQQCLHKNLMARVEQSKALSRKANPIAFSLQSNKDERNN
jgi:hypothetical protein